MSNPYPTGGPPSFSPPQRNRAGSYRRPSYATVAAGTAATFEPLRTNPYTDAATAASDGTHRGEQQPQVVGHHSRHSSRSMDIDSQGGGTAWKRSSGAAWSRDRLGCLQHDEHPPFFTPSYLRQSRHVQKLHQAYDEHMAALRETTQIPPSKPLPLSTSSSNVNLSKMHSTHAHRPPVQDVVERIPPPVEEDPSHPLPSRWSEEDKMNGLEILADGTEVRFGGVTKTSDEAASIRSDHPMPKECGLYYFEVTILSRGKDGLIGIGFSAKKANLNRLPGWETESWAYHGDDGFSFACTASGRAYGPCFSSQDVIGCGVNFRSGTAFFTKNGVYLGTAFTGISKDRLFPSVGMKKPGEHLRINFGRTPFVFDIDRMMEQERQAIFSDIGKTDVTNLHPPDDESLLIHSLIGQYLAHEGYVGTAKAFAQDITEQQKAFQPDRPPALTLSTDDDIHAINRQKIRKSILDGDIDRALKYTSSYYPRILEEDRNKDIYFRLKCRKFIEMMRRYTELAAVTSSSHAMPQPIDSLESNGHPSHIVPAADSNGTNSQMELDDQLHREVSPSVHPAAMEDVDMDASQELSAKSSFMKESNLLTAALAYGQELQHEFGSDTRPQVKKQLQDLFAIIAYMNPAESPIGPLLDPQGRVLIAEEINGAILVSLGKPSSAALEKLCAQTEALLDETAAKHGGAAAFVNARKDFLQG